MHEVLVNRLGGLSLPRKSVVRLTDRPDMTLDVYRGRKTKKKKKININLHEFFFAFVDKELIEVGSTFKDKYFAPLGANSIL